MTVGVRSMREILGAALDTLSGALQSHIADGLKGRIATEDWTQLLELKDAQEGRPVRPVSPHDLVAQVRVMTTSFPEAGHLFDLDRAQLRHLGEIRDVRNAWAHGEEFSSEDLRRAVDTAARLLRSLGLDGPAEALHDLVSEEADDIAISRRDVETSSPERPDRGQSQQETSQREDDLPHVQVLDCKIRARHLGSINFAAIQSAAPGTGERSIIEQVRLENRAGASDTYTLTAQLFSAVGPLSDVAERIIDLAPGDTTVLNFDVAPDAAKFLALDTRQSGHLRFQLRQDDRVLVEHRSDISLLPANHWQGNHNRRGELDQASAEMLAAFVQPQHPAITELLSRSQDLLKQRTGSSAIDAHQGADAEQSAERIDHIVEAIYDAMASSGIRYSNPPASWDVSSAGGQRVRNPQEVLVGKVGTCLDTTVVLAAALEAAGIDSAMWLVRGHAFLGYFRSPRGLGMASSGDFDAVVSLGHADAMRIVETTAVASGQKMPLKEAAAGTRFRYFTGEGTDPSELFEFAIDIRACRRAGIYPMPARTLHDDGSVTVVSYTPSAADSLAEFFGRKSEQRVGLKPTGKTFPPRVLQWKNQLLDLSLRNRLLNFSERARFPLAVPADAVEAFEDLLNDGQVIELVASDQVGGTDRETYGSGFNLPVTRRNDLLLRDRKVFTQSEERTYVSALRKMAFAAKTELQESGANNLYVAIGTLIWASGEKSQRSPLILVPVNLIASGKNGNYRLELDSSGSSTPNFCLLEKLRQDFDLEIPGLEDPDVDASGIDVKKAFQSVRAAVAEANLSFHVEETVDLANLQFAKFRLWKDLDENWNEFAKNPLVKHLIETPTEVFEEPAAKKADASLSDLDELAARCPVPADASQLEAVSMAAAGRTFVLEGPPGTGKSQTITNLLATAMSQGKRVLFVAEKRAALEVVQQRLAAVGLGPFTLDLHDKGSKVNDVRRQIQEALDHKIRRDEQGRSILEADLRSARRRLTKYADRLHEQNSTGMSAYSAHTQELAIDPDVVPLPVSAQFAATASIEDVNAIRHALNELPDVADLARPVRVHPWGFLTRPIADDEVDGIVDAAERFAAAVTAVQEESAVPGLVTFVESSGSPKLLTTIVDVLRAGVPADVLDNVRTPAWQGKVEQGLTDAGEVTSTDRLVGRIFAPGIFEMPLDGLLLAAEEAANSGFLGIGRKKKIQAVVDQLGDAWMGSEDNAASLAELLRQVQQLNTRIGEIRTDLAGLPGIDVSRDWLPFVDGALDSITAQAERLTFVAEWRDRIRLDAPASTLHALDTLTTQSDQARRAAELLSILAQAWDELLRQTPENAHGFESWAEGQPLPTRWSRSDFPRAVSWDGQRQLKAWNELLTVLEPLRESLLFDARDALLRAEYPADFARQGFERGLSEAAMSERLSTTGLSSFDAKSHEFQIASYADKAARMREHMSWWLPENILAYRKSDFVFSGPRSGMLSRQLGRQRGGLGVRALMTEYGDIITRALPCTLVSPDSVARFFPPTAGMFDLVVFDEASQVRVADAVGAIGRGKAVIVVGDSKQMPPTSVAAFGSIDEEDIPDGLIVDEESILTECEQARIPRLWLSWHYRSQDESLIAFSNHMYYDNKLASFPAPRFVEASSSTGGYGIALVRVDGQFYRTGTKGIEARLRRTNPVEARAIVDEIKRRFASSTDGPPSLGVVTFNLQQRTLIESMIREDDDERMAISLDEMDGIFVKNLENVQGDERDVILFSTAFSPNEKGTLPLNFGPLNNPGGERRLNVAVTRARRQVVVFSSFDPEQLRAEDSSSLGIKHLRAYLDLAARGPEAIPSADSSLSRIDRHREEVAEALRLRGYDVRTNVGLSEFKIDLSLAAKDQPERPILAVLLDGEEWSERRTVGDRDGLPRDVLENVLKWPGTTRVWLPEWLVAHERVCQRIDKQFDAALREIGRRETERATALAIAAQRVTQTTTVPNESDAERALVTAGFSYGALISESDGVDLQGSVRQDNSSERATVGQATLIAGPEDWEVPDEVSDIEVFDLRESGPNPVGGVPHGDKDESNSAEPEEDDGQADDEEEEFKDRLKYDPEAFDPEEFDYPFFSAWYLVAEVGDLSDLDRVADPDVTKKIREVANDVVEDEWPVKQERLARFINNAFGLRRVSPGRANAVLKRLEPDAYRTDSDGFVWPASVRPDTWFAFRCYSEGEDIPVTDICRLEIANAMAHCVRLSEGLTTAALKEKMKDYLGFTRMGPKVSSWLDQAIELGIERGRLSRNGDVIMPDGKWAEGMY